MMGYIVLIVIITFLALIGKGILGFTPVLALLLALTFVLNCEVGLAMGFFSGILLSILSGALLGQESLALILAMSLLYLYNRRFSKQHLLYLALFSGLGSIIYSIILGREITLGRLLVDILLVFIFLPMVKSIDEHFFRQTIVLKL